MAGWQERSKRLLPELALLLAAAGLVYAAFRLGRWYNVPHEVLAFEDHRDAFTQVAGRLLRGEEVGPGDPVLDVLRQAGVKRVRREGGCVVFTFWFLPVDPVPEIVYSPDGFRGLPPMSINSGTGLHLTRFQYLDGDWFYWSWDY